MKRSKIVAWITVALALIAGLLTLLVPSPSAANPGAFHSSLFQSVLIAIFQFGAAFLFVWGLKGFKRELRVAYGLTCAGIVVLGLSSLQLPVVAYFSLGESVYVESGIIAIPYIAPALLSFFGAKIFAKLFKVKSLWMSFWFVMVVAVIGAAAAVGLTALTNPAGSKDLVGNIAISTWTATFLLASLIAIIKSRRVAGTLYQDALRWFVAARAIAVVTGFSYAFLLVILGNQHPLHEYGAVLLPGAVAALLSLRSGYAFKLINEDQEATLHSGQSASIIDIITFAASQASNPSELDTELDTLRIVTASMDGSNRTLTAEQQESLKGVYAAIEYYLVRKEPIRHLTAEEIRRKGALYFGMDYAAFVAAITSAPAGQAQLHGNHI